MVRFLRILKINFQLSIQNNLLAAALYLLAVPVWRGIENLNEVRAAECLNQSIILIGILLIVPLAAPEQDLALREAVYARKTPQWMILFMRLVMAAGFLVLLTGIFAGIMIMKNCTFPYAKYVLGTVISELALGGAGLLAAVLSNSVTAGYLVSAGLLVYRCFGM